MTADDRPQRLGPADLHRLIDASLPALRAYVRARLGPALAAHESSSDVVQSVCRELLAEHRVLEYRGDAAFRGWLFSAALHKIWEHDRRRRATTRAGAEPAPDPTSEAQAQAVLEGYAHLVTPSREVSAREQLGRLEAALAALAAGDRELIALAKIAGLPHAEIAARTGKSEEACRQGLRRALVRLAAKLDAHQDPG